MKRIRNAIIIIAALAMMTATAMAQLVTIGTGSYIAGKSVFLQTSVDTSNTAVKYTDYWDITDIDGQSIYLTYDYVTAGGTSDSLQVIIKEKLTPNMIINADTVYLVGATSSSVKQILLTPTAYGPLAAVFIKNYYGGALDQRNAAGTVKLNFYTRTTDVTYYKQ